MKSLILGMALITGFSSEVSEWRRSYDVKAVLNPYHSEGNHAQEHECDLSAQVLEQQVEHLRLLELRFSGSCITRSGERIEFRKVGFWGQPGGLKSIRYRIDPVSQTVLGRNCDEVCRDEVIGTASFENSKVHGLRTESWLFDGDLRMTSHLLLKENQFYFEFINHGDDWNGAYFRVTPSMAVPE